MQHTGTSSCLCRQRRGMADFECHLMVICTVVPRHFPLTAWRMTLLNNAYSDPCFSRTDTNLSKCCNLQMDKCGDVRGQHCYMRQQRAWLAQNTVTHSHWVGEVCGMQLFFCVWSFFFFFSLTTMQISAQLVCHVIFHIQSTDWNVIYLSFMVVSCHLRIHNKPVWVLSLCLSFYHFLLQWQHHMIIR